MTAAQKKADFDQFEATELYCLECGRAVPVSYAGLIPDTFKDDAEVVVEGVCNPDDPSFNATTLLAKCPSKYESRGDQHPEDISVEKVSSAQ